ncbi:arrestin domain-containing protein 17 isoform X5 [Nomia melanderi]|uniref:arrestin domain-containing protein 17 isoform X5 n=1 Tax=Nomia melanderi TaxID=2448451 RepID=UPI003FCEAAD1
MDEEAESPAEQAIAATLSESIGFRRIDIVLDQPQQVYYSGQQISGHVHLDVSEPVNVLGIRLKYKGEAQVYFTDRSAGIRRKFSAFESYLHVETYLAGDGKEKSTITGGVYPFSLTLPENLPCSFEGRYGRVRYSIRALLDVTTIYRFSTNIIPFTVAPILDLNRDPLAALPINIQQSKVYMGQTEPISVSMSLPVHSYVPGQTIPIKIALTNPSTVAIKKIRVVFKKVVTYHATEKSRKHKEIVVEIEQPVNKESETYDVLFDVPAVPPTGMIHCTIIDVVYTLKIVSEELETANEYSGRHGTTRKLRDPAKNGGRDGSFSSSSTVHNDHRRTRQQRVTIEKHRERGDYEVEFVSATLREKSDISILETRQRRSHGR